MLSCDFRAVFESECHCAILVDRHLVDYSKPQFFVKLSYGKRSALNVFDEAFDDFALANLLISKIENCDVALTKKAKKRKNL